MISFSRGASRNLQGAIMSAHKHSFAVKSSSSITGVAAVFAGGVLGAVFLLAAARAQAAEYFVAPTGSDTNPGTMAAPFATIQKGHDVRRRGRHRLAARRHLLQHDADQVCRRAGPSDTNRIKFWAYQSEVPILDCSRYVSTNKAADVPASWSPATGCTCAGSRSPTARSAPAATTPSRTLRTEERQQQHLRAAQHPSRLRARACSSPTAPAAT